MGQQAGFETSLTHYFFFCYNKKGIAQSHIPQYPRQYTPIVGIANILRNTPLCNSKKELINMVKFLLVSFMVDLSSSSGATRACIGLLLCVTTACVFSPAYLVFFCHFSHNLTLKIEYSPFNSRFILAPQQPP